MTEIIWRVRKEVIATPEPFMVKAIDGTAAHTIDGWTLYLGESRMGSSYFLVYEDARAFCVIG